METPTLKEATPKDYARLDGGDVVILSGQTTKRLLASLPAHQRAGLVHGLRLAVITPEA